MTYPSGAPASPEPAPSDQGVRHAVAIDYVDFLQWGGRNYTAATSFGVARLGTVPVATRADLGPTVFTVTCRLGQWNELTHAEPSVARPRAEALLTARETEVLKLSAKGYNHGEVARLLDLSPNTVASYTRKIYEKLEVRSRTEAVFEASRLGLLESRD